MSSAHVVTKTLDSPYKTMRETMLLKLRKTTIEELSHKYSIKDAKKASLVFSDSTIYFEAIRWEDNAGLGFCGYQAKGCIYIMKNDYIIPKYRNKGYGQAMLERRINMARIMGFMKARATCTNMSLGYYIKKGFMIVKTYKNGLNVVDMWL